MQVDRAQINRAQLSKEELKKLRDEGRCFICKKKGHLSRQCPDRQKGKDKSKGRPRRPEITARITEVESSGGEADESESDDDIKSQASTRTQASSATAVTARTATKATSLLAKINRLTTQEKTEVVDSLLNEGF